MSQHGELVLELIQKWAGVVPSGGIRPEHRLVDDLEMDGDDYGMSFVPELKKRLGISPMRREWEEVVTVGDVLWIVDRHVARKGSGGEQASA